MTKDLPIKVVQVEFLRGGPPHNQLLSPLTSYLAISGNAGAGIVNVPYEHAEFERRLKELRYETGDICDRKAMLATMGSEMGRLLGGVPGVPGALDSTRADTIVQLRITLSASELAILPFELAKMPISDSATGENSLSLQNRPPICITRNIRTVSPEGVTWPDTPRILFIVGDKDSTPYEEHREVLLQAIKPFQMPTASGTPEPEANPDEPRQQFQEWLTILVNPTIAQIAKECRRHAYTHVHVLAHGAVIEASRNSYGLALQGKPGKTNVISGEQFAGALASVQGSGIHRPTVVTLASCDSGNGGSVIVPGASFAHALHQSGIPLVVGSQFPLSKDGSIPLTETLYEGLLWGENPLVLLHEARANLNMNSADYHDWASLVVYEALPQTWSEQLDRLRYCQSKRSMQAVLQRIDLAVAKARDEKRNVSLEGLHGDLKKAQDRLPLNGAHGIECLGLRASSHKRLAEAVSQLPEGALIKSLPSPRKLLQEALQDYDDGARALLLNDVRGVQRVATMHWLLVQKLSLVAVLGGSISDSEWGAAELCADLYADHPDRVERAWARGSLAELWLIRLAKPDLTPKEKQEISTKALDQLRLLNAFYPENDAFPIESTRKQFGRYVKWWGKQNRDNWSGENGLLLTAGQMLDMLKRDAPSPSKEGHDDDFDEPESVVPQAPVKSRAKKAPAEASADSLAKKPSAKAAVNPPRPPKIRTGPFFDVELLPAQYGDSIWIEYGEGNKVHRLLIDCGTPVTSKVLTERIQALDESDRAFELFVMSHIDDDHIGGAIPFLKALPAKVQFADVWFNGWRHISGQLNAVQGEVFSAEIEGLKLPWNLHFAGKAVVTTNQKLPEITLPGGMKLTLLSPTSTQLEKLALKWKQELAKAGLIAGAVDLSQLLIGTPSQSTDVDELADTPFESDSAEANGSSIAFLAEYGGAAILFGADSHAPVLVKSINDLLAQRNNGKKLKLDAFKVSHHASKNNVSSELIGLLDCPRYLISTNGSRFYHPDRQVIGRILKYGRKKPHIHFNYRSKFNEVWERPDLQEKYAYTTHFPENGAAGIDVALIASQ